MKKFFYISVAVWVIMTHLSSCKSFQKTTSDSTRKISLNKLIKELDKNRFSARSFETKIGISYRDASQSFNGAGKIRILKDSIIWGSLNFMGIPMAKFMITPGRIRYYNKLDQEYYDGNFDLIRQSYGVDIDFNNLQSLLLGDLPVSLDKTYDLEIEKNYYLLHSPEYKQVNEIKLTPFFKILSEKIGISPAEFVQVNYTDYQKIDKEDIPRNLEIQTRNTSKDMYLKLEYKSPSINKDLRFPFKIPSSYQPLELP